MKHVAGRKRHSAEDIVRKLRRSDELAAAGKTGEEIAAELEVSPFGRHGGEQVLGGHVVSLLEVVDGGAHGVGKAVQALSLIEQPTMVDVQRVDRIALLVDTALMAARSMPGRISKMCCNRRSCSLVVAAVAVTGHFSGRQKVDFVVAAQGAGAHR